MPLGDAQYEELTAGNQTLEVGSGETLENLLIDVSNGGGVTIRATGTNWTIRNVGIAGYYEGDGFVFIVSDTDPAGESLIENVYVADGAAKAGSGFVNGPGAIYVGLSEPHEGHVTFRECNVQGFTNNGIYASNGPGSVSLDHCLVANNGIANVRLGDTDGGGDEISTSLVFNDGTEYGWFHEDNDFLEENGRGVWMWNPGNVALTDVHIDAGQYPVAVATRGGATVTYHSGGVAGEVSDNVELKAAVTDEPDHTVPEGVPLSAEQAATGGAHGGGEPTPPTDADDGYTNVTAIQTHYHSDPEAIEIRNVDVNWNGAGRIARSYDGGTATVYESRFDGDSPDSNLFNFDEEFTSGDGANVEVPEAVPANPEEALETSVTYQTIRDIYVRDAYLAEIDGVAVHVGGEIDTGEVVVERVHIDGADIGILVDGVAAEIWDCEIVADQPIASINGGEIADGGGVNVGGSADPKMRARIPATASEAAGIIDFAHRPGETGGSPDEDEDEDEDEGGDPDEEPDEGEDTDETDDGEDGDDTEDGENGDTTA